MDRVYACIDLKSFYASVECVIRNLDPLKTNLVVADPTRTQKTICLAITPSLKKLGLPGRARLFEVDSLINKINYQRRKNSYNNKLIGKSFNEDILNTNNRVAIDYIVAKPQMSLYIKYSTDIYKIYLKYLAPEDIYIYSIDEVFCDITDYLKLNKKNPREFITMIIHDIYKSTGITATAGIGTNLYLAKIAMDILAKHTKADELGVRIAYLDELSYRKKLWDYKPLTAFWRVGPGYQKKLESNHLYTMGDIARCSIENEELLYKLFGVNAEILIDHAWGYEPCTIKDIKNFKPIRNSLGQGQVLHCPYNYEKTKVIIKEMADSLALDLVSKDYVTNQIILNIGYDVSNIKDGYNGLVELDHYNRSVPKQAHGTLNLEYYTSSSKVLIDSFLKLYNKIVNKNLTIRRLSLTASNVIPRQKALEIINYKQYDLFSDSEELPGKVRKQEQAENNLQKTIIEIKNKYGKNAVLKGMNLEEGATMKERNHSIGGHSE